MADDPNFLSRWSRRKAVARSGAPTADATALPIVTTAAPAVPALVTVPVPAELPMAPAAARPVVTSQPESDAARDAEDPPALTLADVAKLSGDSDYSAFVARDVAPEVRNAALKRLFTDPHYNVMDGLDTYIDDYGKPDPLPPGMLRQMTQSAFLKLFDDDEADATAAAETATADPAAAADPADPADTLPAQSAIEDPALPAAAPSPPIPAQATEPAPDEDFDLRLQPDDAAGRTGAVAGAGQNQRRQL